MSHTAGAWPREGGGGTRQRAAKFSNCRPDKGALPSRKQGKTTLQVDPLWDYFCLGIREQITADTDNNQPGVVELINIFFFFFLGTKTNEFSAMNGELVFGGKMCSLINLVYCARAQSLVCLI